MPIYEYICQECQSPFERIVLSKTERIACPKCGSKRHTMKFSVVNTAIKSGGDTAQCGMGDVCGMDPSTCDRCG